jgi:outer membrane receptor protein involved in Fe transport
MLALSACCLQAQIALTGSVSSENSAPIAGARVMLRSSGGLLVEAVSGAAGLFTCSIPDPGTYSLSAERTGYFRLPERELRVAPDMGELHLVLTPVREVYESIDVTAAPQALDMATAAPRKILSGAQAIAIPFPSSNSLKNALRVMPGVVQDSRAGIHLNGGAEDQILFTLDGFTVNDPYTGRFDTRVGVEAIQSMEIVDGQLPAEFGKGAAGMVAISTTSGDDRIRPSLTNFFPGIETANGIFIGNWSPRFSLSGPIRKGRAWFSDSIATQYDQEYLPDMPGKDTRLSSWRLSNLLHTQVNLTRFCRPPY